MNGIVAQIVALTCHANAAILGSIRPFFPDNSTCRFCNTIRFVAPSHDLSGGSENVVVAADPDEWLSLICRHSALGVRLHLERERNPQISDRMSAGFVGGGGLWNMLVVRGDSTVDRWVAHWEVSDRDAPDSKIWRVTYTQVGSFADNGEAPPALVHSAARLRNALQQIEVFAQAHDLGGFAETFRQASACLDDRRSCVPYHRDLCVEGTLPALAESVLLAAQSAWVFGGMGSWNDMSFEGAAQADYDGVSITLFEALRTAITDATNCSVPSRGWTRSSP
jgi:hypothetical protein